MASQELQVKNCKPRISSQELQKCGQIDFFSRGLMIEIIFSLLMIFDCFLMTF
jgi:hypothetical protein